MSNNSIQPGGLTHASARVEGPFQLKGELTRAATNSSEVSQILAPVSVPVDLKRPSLKKFPGLEIQ